MPSNISYRFLTERLTSSVPKYSRYIFGGRNAQFSIGTRQEKGRVECLWEFQIFYQGIIAQIFGKNICYFKSPISPWRGPQSKSLFWAFFLNSLWSPSTKKISFDWAPLLAFPNVWLNIFKFCFLNICCNFWGKNLGHYLVKATWSGQIYLFFTEKWGLIFEHFLALKMS